MQLHNAAFPNHIIMSWQRERNRCSVEPIKQVLPRSAWQPRPLSVLNVELTQLLNGCCGSTKC